MRHGSTLGPCLSMRRVFECLPEGQCTLPLLLTSADGGTVACTNPFPLHVTSNKPTASSMTLRSDVMPTTMLGIRHASRKSRVTDCVG